MGTTPLPIKLAKMVLAKHERWSGKTGMPFRSRRQDTKGQRMKQRRAFVHPLPLPLLLLMAFMTLLWVAGGASRGDTLGQALVRGGACATIAIALLSLARFEIHILRPIWFVLLAALAIPLAQLIPLPPGLWISSSGHNSLRLAGDDVWRALTLSPGATVNAAGALIVPSAVLVLLSQMSESQRARVVDLLLFFIGAAGLLGTILFSGAEFDNPFINDVRGQGSSVFANRNHFALLVAMGCVVAPVWAFMDLEGLRWRGPLSGALMLLFVLMVIATGSRTGLLLVSVSLVLSLVLVGKPIRRSLRGAPPWVFPVIASTAFIVLLLFVTLSFLADRVEAVDRLFSLTVTEDLRVRAQPTLLDMISTYFPWGGGVGSFDATFRVNEPDTLLAPQYFNQAHNDYLGIILDAGFAGAALLTASVLWWALATLKVLRAPNHKSIMLGRLGSALLLLVLIASATDYPARTPTMMAVIVIAGAWLASASASTRQPALPQRVSDV